jgi:hypothetical protein
MYNVPVVGMDFTSGGTSENIPRSLKYVLEFSEQNALKFETITACLGLPVTQRITCKHTTVSISKVSQVVSCS